MTKNKEDFLKAIYMLGGSEELVSNKSLAGELGVAPASVTEMLIRLQKEGLIDYLPYKGTRLTAAGAGECIHLVRAHRLWEVFLIRHLGYTWSEAHEDAHLLEHLATQRMTRRLDRFLNYPAYCPHGSVIPPSDGPQPVPRPMRPLSELEIGERATLIRITEEAALLDYLEPLGFVVGGVVEMLGQEPYEGPVTVSMEGKQVTISHKAAGKLYVTCPQ